MKSSTIWETASRPLFVRTVWLEGSELRRGFQRHFLLDYETSRPWLRLNSLIAPLQYNNTVNSKRSICLDLNEFEEFDALSEEGTEVFLIGSAKAKLHVPYKSSTNKKSKLLKYRRRSSSLYNRQYPSEESYNLIFSKNTSGRPPNTTPLQSRKNSLTQSQSITETADVLLAERVLQWLDLAGKESFLKNLHELQEMEVKLSKTSKLRQDAIKRYNSKVQSNQKPKEPKIKKYERAGAATPQMNTQSSPKSKESVKHITIIFNKEGQPVRLNRPAKNIDLCALSTSPTTTRRLTGTLASSRLYKSAEINRCINAPKTSHMKSKTANEGNKSLLYAHRRLDTVADLNNSTLQKRLHVSSMPGGCSKLNDCKKQLHIFMPTLLKKGLNKSISGGEDGISELSHNFSELCIK